MHILTLIILLPFTIGTLVFDDFTVDETMTQMDSDSPGSVSAFIDWGVEEAKIEECLNSVLLPSHLFPRPLSIAQFTSLVWYTRPKNVDKNELLHLVQVALANNRIAVSSATARVAAPTPGQYVLWMKRLDEIMTKIPDDVLSVIASIAVSAKTVGLPVDMNEIISNIRKIQRASSPAYSQVAVINHWINRCIYPLTFPVHQTAAAPCKHNINTRTWDMTESSRLSIHRFYAMQAVRDQNL